MSEQSRTDVQDMDARVSAIGGPGHLGTGDGAAVLEEVSRLQEENDDLRAALASRASIEQAKGILMARHDASPEQAFAILRRWSQTRNVKLRVLARALVEEVSRPVSVSDSPGLPRPFLLGQSPELRLVQAQPDHEPDEKDTHWVPRAPKAPGSPQR